MGKRTSKRLESDASGCFTPSVACRAGIHLKFREQFILILTSTSVNFCEVTSDADAKAAMQGGFLFFDDSSLLTVVSPKPDCYGDRIPSCFVVVRIGKAESLPRIGEESHAVSIPVSSHDGAGHSFRLCRMSVSRTVGL